MGFVPPTLEEWENPVLWSKRIQKEQRIYGFLLGAGIMGFFCIGCLLWVVS